MVFPRQVYFLPETTAPITASVSNGNAGGRDDYNRTCLDWLLLAGQRIDSK